jgi:hypothetical protein
MAEHRDDRADDLPSLAGDRSHLRAAHTDREHVIGVLTTAFVRGMLDKNEFDQRVDQALAGRTYGELAAVTADLPAGLPAAGPLPVPQPATAPDEGWLTMTRAVIVSACLLVPTALATGIGAPLVGRYHNQGLIFFPTLAFFLATAVSTVLIAEARYRQRSRPRRPPAPATGAGRQVTGQSRAGRRRAPGRGLTLTVIA